MNLLSKTIANLGGTPEFSIWNKGIGLKAEVSGYGQDLS